MSKPAPFGKVATRRSEGAAEDQAAQAQARKALAETAEAEKKAREAEAARDEVRNENKQLTTQLLALEKEAEKLRTKAAEAR